MPAVLGLTRLERMLSASKALSPEHAELYEDMFVRLKSEEQLCVERQLSKEGLASQVNDMMRNLRAAIA